MKKITLVLVMVFLASCSGVKQTEKALHAGNYNTAIEKAVQKLQHNADRKNSDEYVVLLEEAYAKANSKDVDRITYLKADGNKAHLEEIYNIYVALNYRQNYIKPLLPLAVNAERRSAQFNIVDYSATIAEAKTALSEYLYTEAVASLQQEQPKYVYRNVYENLAYLNNLNPNYKDVASLLQTTLEKGTEYIAVYIQNTSNVMIPYQLEQDLLDFNSYGLSSNWTVFHSNPLPNKVYDYEVTMNFEAIEVSPEFVNEKEYVKEKQIVDGKTNLYDEEGNVVKDSLGNEILVDKYTTVVCSFYQFTQNKTAQVMATVSLFDTKEQQLVDTFPMNSQFVFNNSYAKHRGDTRALENNQLDLLEVAALQFPSDEQMVYDAGENLKDKMKSILKKYTL
ncbi:hypothetical protein [Neptunitalea lumnitzerae]|uniref:Lipoprotein n=1 Tax=Neptunitalea lumnitzerae TaxID=2965509 RepID=A0ABQ5MIH4_9FLAO|nr:hypothetical protein [Neptunitalea sp. Y10]GLB49215.1 hypothetical protein Y10_15830 [Neptunitalea sp. Y10]